MILRGIRKIEYRTRPTKKIGETLHIPAARPPAIRAKKGSGKVLWFSSGMLSRMPSTNTLPAHTTLKFIAIAGLMRCVSLPLLVLVCATAGCARKMDVRVLDDATGNPVAGARVSPWLDDLWGAPYQGPSVVTGADGRAQSRMPSGGRKGGFSVEHPEFREFHPADKPMFAGDERLLYMRLPPRVTLLLPPGFRGPVLISALSGFDERQESLEFPLAATPTEPTALPGGTVGDLVEWGEIEAVQEGRRISPGKKEADAGETHVWYAAWAGTFYEDNYVSFLFIGTRGEFAAFSREWSSAVGDSFPSRLQREQYERIRRAFGGTPSSLPSRPASLSASGMRR